MAAPRPSEPRRSTHPEEAPHDVLAAEEFVLPATDPRLHEDPPHDVLAAEEFVVPASDPELHHGPVTLPDDPTGIAEAHDVLAAEEFALPAPRPHHDSAAARGGSVHGRAGAYMAVAGALLFLRRRRSRRRG